jgi:Mg2+-importing ATPase
MRGVVRYAGIMGPLSSVFDGLTFLILLIGLQVAAPESRTAWFTGSIAMQILVVSVIRTSMWRSPPVAVSCHPPFAG